MQQLWEQNEDVEEAWKNTLARIKSTGNFDDISSVHAKSVGTHWKFLQCRQYTHGHWLLRQKQNQIENVDVWCVAINS